MVTFKYRNMKFSRNDLPFRKAPEKSKNQQIIYFLCQLSIPHFWTATLCIPETCVDFYVLPATDMMQMGLSLMLSLFRISLRASSSRKNLCVSLSSSIFTICTAFPMITLPVTISEISKVRQRSIHSFQIGSISNDACGLWIGSQFPVFALQRTSASYF